ncbi:hypothetical protein ACE14D_08270 [Streptomyces sp. Act-28]
MFHLVASEDLVEGPDRHPFGPVSLVAAFMIPLWFAGVEARDALPPLPCANEGGA